MAASGHGDRSVVRTVARLVLGLVGLGVAAVLLTGCEPSSPDIPAPGACTANWIGATGDDFTSAAAWDTGTVPGPADTACAPVDSAIVVSSAVSLDGANLQGLVTTTGPGSLYLAALGNLSFVGHLDLAGTLDGPGAVSLGQLTWRSGGHMTGSGFTIVANYGPSSIDGSVEVDGTRAINVLGDLSWNQGNIRLCEDSTLGITGTLTVSAATAAMTSVGCATTGSAHVVVNPGGTWTTSATAVDISVPLENDGRLVVAAPNTLWTGVYAQSGGTTTLTGTGAALQIGGGSGTLDLGGGTLEGTGSLLGKVTGAGTVAPTVTSGLLSITLSADLTAVTMHPTFTGPLPPHAQQTPILSAGTLTHGSSSAVAPPGFGIGYYQNQAWLFDTSCDPTNFHPGGQLQGVNAASFDLTACDLTGANLLGANLNAANFTNATLSGANISDATFVGTIWSNTICPDGTNSDAHSHTCVGHSPTHSFTVNTTLDLPDAVPGDGRCKDEYLGACSLRGAIQEANADAGADTIWLAVNGEYDLSTDGTDDSAVGGDLDITRAVTINGNGSTIRQTTPDRVFDVRGASTVPVTMSLINIQDGDAGAETGGGIRNTANLTLSRVTVTKTAATGAAVDSSGTLTITSATIADNRSGGIVSRSSVALTDTTITQNDGTGLTKAGGTARASNTIIASQRSGPDCSGSVTSQGYNLASDATCGLTGTADLQNTDPSLGGMTITNHRPLHLPTLGSPAIDTGRPACTGVDARGVSRPKDGNGDGTAACDRGAVELGVVSPLTLTVNDGSDVVDVNPGDGLCRTSYSSCTLRAAIMEANATNGGDTINLAPAATYTLFRNIFDEDGAATGDLDIATPLTIHGNGSTITVPWGESDRVFDVFGRGTAVTIDHLGIVGGTTLPGLSTGAVRNRATLTLDTMTIGGPVGGLVNQGNAIVRDSTISVTGSAVQNLVSATATLQRVRLTGTTNPDNAAGGTAIRNDGTVTIDGAEITRNTGGTDTVSTTGSFTARTMTLADNGSVGLRVLGGTASVTDSTITKNTGGGIVVGAGTVTTTNSIIADQVAGPDCTGAVTSGGTNLTSDASCALAGTGDLQNQPGTLAALTPYRSWSVHLPLPGSPAIDSGAATCGAVDVRNAPRPQASTGVGTPLCDRGAVEVTTPTPLSLSVTSTADTVDAVPGDGVCATTTPGECTLRAAIMEANATSGPDTVTLAASATYQLRRFSDAQDDGANGDLDITTPIAIIGHGATIQALSVDGSVDRVFDIFGRPMAVTIDDVDLKYGDGPGTVRNRGDLTLRGSSISLGSGAIVNSGSAAILDTSISANDGTYRSAPSVSNSGTLTLTRTSITGSKGATETIANTGTLALVGADIGDNLQPGIRSSAGSVTITDSTITANTGGGLVTTGGTITATNSIIADQTSGPDCSGAIGSGGHNLSSDASCGLIAAADVQSTPAGLAPARLVARRSVHLPILGSAAVDSGAATCGTVDIRQVTRPADGDGNANAVCDRGAAELPVPTDLSMTVNSTLDKVDANPGDGICATDVVGQCTLRAAIMESAATNGRDTIDLAPGATYTLTPTPTGYPEDAGLSGDLDLASPLVLNGHAATVSASDLADNGVDIFGAPTTDVVVHDLTVTGAGTDVRNRAGLTATNVAALNGSTGMSNRGALHLDDSRIVGHTGLDNAVGGVATLTRVDLSGMTGGSLSLDQGVAARNAGTLTLNASTVTGNAQMPAAVLNTGTLALVSSTISDNRVVGVRSTAGTVSVTSSTISSNTGGGLSAPSGTVTASNSIIADQTSGPNCSAAIVSAGYNLASDASCVLAGTADLQNTPARLRPLGMNGGPLKSRVPAFNSAAVDSGLPGCSGLDVRGLARPQDGNGDGTATCDRGPVEAAAYRTLSMTVNSTLDQVDAAPGDGVCQTTTVGVCTLRAAVMEADASSGPDQIALAPVTYTLTIPGQNEDAAVSGDLDITDGLVLTGNSATIDGGSLDTVLHVGSATGFSATGLTITHGSNQSDGSALQNAGTTALTDVVITANGSAGSGSVVRNSGSLTLTMVSLSANTSASAIFGLSGSTLAVIRSTIAHNVVIDGLYLGGTATVTASTISDNGNNVTAVVTGTAQITDSTIVAASGGTDLRSIFGGQVTVTNTILGRTGSGTACYSSTLPTSGGWNLAADASCALTGPSDLVGNPNLGALGNNGGPTQTHLPLAGSPAIDSGSPSCSGTDQRGVARPQGAACDRGAVEQ